jgi:hypothetical protein
VTVDNGGGTITLGGTTLELTCHGLNHSNSTPAMRRPKKRIILVAETIPAGQVPGRAVLASAPSPVRGRTPARKESLDHRRRYRRV